MTKKIIIKIILSILILIISYIVLTIGVTLYYVYKVNKEVAIIDWEEEKIEQMYKNMELEKKAILDSLRNQDFTIKDDCVQFYEDAVFGLSNK